MSDVAENRIVQPIRNDPPAPSPAPSPGTIYKLSKPIMVHTRDGIREVKEVPLREPTADDILALGMPWRTILGQNAGAIATVEMAFTPDVVRNWISRLSGLSQGEFGAMHARDVRGIYDWLSSQLAPLGQDEQD